MSGLSKMLKKYSKEVKCIYCKGKDFDIFITNTKHEIMVVLNCVKCGNNTVVSAVGRTGVPCIIVKRKYGGDVK